MKFSRMSENKDISKDSKIKKAHTGINKNLHQKQTSEEDSLW